MTYVALGGLVLARAVWMACAGESESDVTDRKKLAWKLETRRASPY